MKVFARVVDEGCFAKAARALDMAPPVVTRRVAELETHPVRAILVGVEEAQALTSQATKALSGHLGVLCPPAILVHQLAKLLSRFQADYPQLALELSSPSPVETVDPAFDVTTFASRQPPDGEFIARQLARTEVVPPRTALNGGGLVFYSGGHGPGAAAQSFKLQLDMHAALATTHTTPCTPRRWWGWV
jgi:DNA-binding transcriptional LysR family regulator